MNNITFKVSPKLIRWMNKHSKKCHFNATAGGQYLFEFLPIGMVECQTVKCIICKQEITDYI